MSATLRPNIALKHASRSTPILPRTLRQMPYFPTRSQSTKPTFTYRLAAASAGKRTSPRPSKLNQDYFLYSSAHPNPNPPYLRSTKKDSGEDAFFATTVSGSANHVAFGVADGVGGWQDQGVDPSDFSHGLCGLMAGTSFQWDEGGGAGGGTEGVKKVTPGYLLKTAYDAIMANPRIIAGGCTASLAVADEEGGMETANLGDSAYLHLSPAKIIHRSAIQTHAFNTPYQLSKVPPRMQAQHAIFGGSHHYSELPEQAEITRHKLKHGDVVVFATDGVWDNLSAMDALEIVTRVMVDNKAWFKSTNSLGAEWKLNSALISSLPQVISEDTQDGYLPGLLATAIMREAKVAGLDRRRDGPFAKEVNAHYPQEGWSGGKPDDIAVVVCVAVEESGKSSGTEKVDEEKPIKAKL